MDQNRLHLSWVKKTLISGFLGGKCIYKKGHFRLFFLVPNPPPISPTTSGQKIEKNNKNKEKINKINKKIKMK